MNINDLDKRPRAGLLVELVKEFKAEGSEIQLVEVYDQSKQASELSNAPGMMIGSISIAPTCIDGLWFYYREWNSTTDNRQRLKEYFEKSEDLTSHLSKGIKKRFGEQLKICGGKPEYQAYSELIQPGLHLLEINFTEESSKEVKRELEFVSM